MKLSIKSLLVVQMWVAIVITGWNLPPVVGDLFNSIVLISFVAAFGFAMVALTDRWCSFFDTLDELDVFEVYCIVASIMIASLPIAMLVRMI